MKKFLKYLFVLTAITLVIIMSLFYFYKNTVINNLIEKKKTATTIWSELYENSNNRIKLIKSITSDIKNKDITIDSLKIVVENNYKLRNFYRKECSLKFVKLEYDLDTAYMKVFMKYSKDSILKKTKDFKYIEKVKYSDNKLNVIIDNYNEATLDYNRYISIFPNFIFAKRNGFIKKKYFNIKYGAKNVDPVVKSKELPEWAKDKDTL